MHGSDENQDTSLDLTNIFSFSTYMPTFSDKNEVDDVHVTCHYHIEGLWENIIKEDGFPMSMSIGEDLRLNSVPPTYIERTRINLFCRFIMPFQRLIGNCSTTPRSYLLGEKEKRKGDSSKKSTPQHFVSWGLYSFAKEICG
ncbi:hypothetical protein CR513_42864, partial [Mucuna pruriens]